MIDAVGSLRGPWPLLKIVRELSLVYGQLPVLRLTPFELIVLENASYLVDDERRWSVFEKLRSTVGITPEAILATDSALLLEAIANGGMKPSMRAGKLRECARLAEEIGVQILNANVQNRDSAGKRLLLRFPSIGEPAADKIMLICAAVPSLAPDSNALRVLTRLGYVTEENNYARQYKIAIKATRDEVSSAEQALEAHLLLRKHGQEICKRSAPRCNLCPLRRACNWYQTIQSA